MLGFKKIIQTKIQENDSYLKNKIKNCLESVFLVFHFILKNPLENFWWECISIIIQHMDIFLYITDKTVIILISYNNYSFGLYGKKRI